MQFSLWWTISPNWSCLCLVRLHHQQWTLLSCSSNLLSANLGCLQRLLVIVIVNSYPGFGSLLCGYCSVLQHYHLGITPRWMAKVNVFHCSIEQILRCYIGPHQSNWVSVLPLAEFALNSTIHVAHGKSPFLVVYGREPSLPLDTAIGQLSDNQVQAVDDFLSMQQQCFWEVRAALAKTADSMAC